MFEIPLQNMVVAPGADVLFKCIITANPPPQGEPWGALEACRLCCCVAWGQDRFPGILLWQGVEEENCQSMGLPQLWCILEDCPLPPQLRGKAAWTSGVRADSSEFPRGRRTEGTLVGRVLA